MTIAIIAALALSSCASQEVDPRFAEPALTFKLHQQALGDRNLELMWSCYSQSFKEGMFGGDFETWARSWREKETAAVAAELEREIDDERLINERIAYLHFDPSTLHSLQASPFSYFLKEADGWKMTPHLDSAFHQELERAIVDGEFKLPDH